MPHYITNKGKYNLLLGRGSGFKIGLLKTIGAGADTQGEIADLDTVTALLSAGCVEVTVAGYARQTLGTFSRTENDGNDRVDYDYADVPFGTLATGETIVGAFIYDPTTDTNDGTRELISVDIFASGVPTNGGTFTYSIANIYQLS